MPPRLFDDDDVRRLLDAPTAVSAVRTALLAHDAGELAAPARVHAALGGGSLVFTAGRLRERGLFGFRSYDTFAGAQQLVALWDVRSGDVVALVHGHELGPRRTGATGAVAADVAANPGPVRLGMVGAGVQAWAQLWALAAVRPVTDVVVTARRRERAVALAERARRELGLPAVAVVPAEEAVRDRDVVVVATNSAAPVLDASWISPGTHVTTLGPKTVSRHEVPATLVDVADCVFTDSAAQSCDLGEEHLFARRRVTELGAVVAGSATARTDRRAITVFSSVGLAGTEVAVAAALYDAAGD
ncbi:NAD(P)-binding domain-containing protein [Streptomyces meridianus]|uniref:NAD(P)-binding domain-containing protein n=1 Tax=Streptomyces meridianus TaxID=2938945 RepID=A0ABT0XC38_9ACTN|nr:NAD(P)-binding domain-containing protein [Streptomyces meridianus]MCM2580090.1 NAD(P)-binding domain-containing protein [Streptomyces meridianus]